MTERREYDAALVERWIGSHPHPFNQAAHDMALMAQSQYERAEEAEGLLARLVDRCTTFWEDTTAYEGNSTLYIDGDYKFTKEDRAVVFEILKAEAQHDH